MSEFGGRWRRALDGWTLPRLPVLADDEGLVVRRGDELSGLDLDGHEQWHVTVGDSAAGGCLVRAAGVLVTTALEAGSPDERLLTFAPDGTTLVRVPVGGQVCVRGALARDDVVDVLVVDGGGHTWRQVVDVATGRLGRRDPLPHGADLLRSYAGGALVASRSAEREGLVALDPDGTRHEVLAEACWSLDIEGEVVVASCAPSAVAVGTVRVLDAADLTERWSRPCRPEAVGLADGVVLAGDVTEPAVVHGLDAWTGESRWRSAPLGAPVLGIRGTGGLVWCTHVAGVVALAAADGHELFRLDGMWSAPTLGGDLGYALGEESLVCFDGLPVARNESR